MVLYTDADLPFDFREVHKAMRLMNQYEADIVAAYRFDRTGEGYVRVVYSFFYNLLVRALFGCRFRDVNFAFKLVRRSVLQKVQLSSEGSFIDAELMVSAIWRGLLSSHARCVDAQFAFGHCEDFERGMGAAFAFECTCT